MDKLIYIGGYGRSGSTILALLLAQAEGVVSVGELGALHRALQQKRTCTCGSTLQECVFWGDLIPSQKDLQNDPLAKRDADVRLAIGHAFEQSGAKALIDSTKTSYKNFNRPRLISRAGYDVRFIHLTRNLKSVIRSSRKGRNSAIETGQAPAERFIATRVFLSWTAANMFAYMYRFVFEERYMAVRYEDLLSNPQKTLERIEHATDLDLSDLREIIDRRVPLASGHEINGNRLLRQGSVVFERAS